MEIKSRKSSGIFGYFQILFQYQIIYDINHPCHPNKKKIYMNFLFLAVIYFLLSIQLNIWTLYNSCYAILSTYVCLWLISPRANSYNLSKNLLVLPWILRLIVDTVNDSTALLMLLYPIWSLFPGSRFIFIL